MKSYLLQLSESYEYYLKILSVFIDVILILSIKNTYHLNLSEEEMVIKHIKKYLKCSHPRFT